LGKFIFLIFGGVDVLNFEPNWLKFRDIDKSIRELRKIYRKNPEWFDIPEFAQKPI
jgi:hypothetical protein